MSIEDRVASKNAKRQHTVHQNSDPLRKGVKCKKRKTQKGSAHEDSEWLKRPERCICEECIDGL